MPYVSRLDRDKARDLRRHQTKAERALWQILRHPDLARWHFRRQHPISPYIDDFACLRARLVIEADGTQHGPENRHDQKRAAFLRRSGWRILRFWNEEILTNPDCVLSEIQLSLAPHLASPTSWGRDRTEQDQGDLK
jgi:primosomal protein N' (replication factor Y)